MLYLFFVLLFKTEEAILNLRWNLELLKLFVGIEVYIINILLYQLRIQCCEKHFFFILAVCLHVFIRVYAIANF